MITDYFISFVTIIFGTFFNILNLPIITTLPTVNGFDIDGALTTGIAELHTYITAVWPLYDLWVAFLIFLAWKALLLIVKFFLGHRAPQYQ